MLGFLFGVILVLFLIVNWSHFQREGFLSLPQFLGGKEILNLKFAGLFNDETCAAGESSEGGLCYKPCKPGFYGRLTMCVAESHNRGIGTVIGLEDCPKGWFTEGLTCREPITGGGCTTNCDGNWNSSDGGFCHTRCNPIVGGRIKGRLDNGGKCPGPQGGDKPDRTDGMCYSNCPADKPAKIPGFPYLCYKGGPLTYDRGAGKVPFMIRVGGKHTFLGRLD